MRFRKRPVVIEAFRLSDVGDPFTMPGWVNVAINSGVMVPRGDGDGYTIKTLEGDHRARIGDWIIQGIKGELYPCKPDIFDATYEAVKP